MKRGYSRDIRQQLIDSASSWKEAFLQKTERPKFTAILSAKENREPKERHLLLPWPTESEIQMQSPLILLTAVFKEEKRFFDEAIYTR